MSARLSKTVTTLLAILAILASSWQGFTGPVVASNSAAPFVCHCCGTKHGKCPTPACCVKRAGEHAPLAPVVPPPTSQNEWHALAAPTGSLLTLPLPSDHDLPAKANFSASFTALPIFQRDSCYLL